MEARVVSRELRERVAVAQRLPRARATFGGEARAREEAAYRRAIEIVQVLFGNVEVPAGAHQLADHAPLIGHRQHDPAAGRQQPMDGLEASHGVDRVLHEIEARDDVERAIGAIVLRRRLHHVRDVPVGDHRLDILQPRRQRGSSGVEVGEDEVVPDFDAKLGEADVFLAEALRALHVGRADQPALRVVRPEVVGASEAVPAVS